MFTLIEFADDPNREPNPEEVRAAIDLLKEPARTFALCVYQRNLVNFLVAGIYNPGYVSTTLGNIAYEIELGISFQDKDKEKALIRNKVIVAGIESLSEYRDRYEGRIPFDFTEYQPKYHEIEVATPLEQEENIQFDINTLMNNLFSKDMLYFYGDDIRAYIESLLDRAPIVPTERIAEIVHGGLEKFVKFMGQARQNPRGISKLAELLLQETIGLLDTIYNRE